MSIHEPQGVAEAVTEAVTAIDVLARALHIEDARLQPTLDVIVANAGICAMGNGQTIQSWSDTIDTDLVGVFNVIQGSLPHIADGGSIIATGSLAAQLGSATNQGPGGSAYSLHPTTSSPPGRPESRPSRST